METAGYRRRTDCRLCGGNPLTPVLSLTPTPPANEFVDASARGRAQPAYPLDVHLCERCAHLQLVDVVDPRVLFENYVYVSGTSPGFVRHFERYATSVAERFALGGGDRVVEVGSNDGVLLRALAGRGLSVLGVDPARDIAARASAEGTPTLAEFFTAGLASRLLAEGGPARLIVANNVFAHADDLRDIGLGIARLLAPDGVFVFEVSYLVDVFTKNLFDTIYHEHLAYHTVGPLVPFFASLGLRVFDAERVDTHGGSLRVFVGVADGPHETRERVADLVARERALGLARAATFLDWSARIEAQGRELRTVLTALTAAGERVAGYGAPAKATTLMHHFGLAAESLAYIVDDSPRKQGLFSPGLHIPVVGPEVLAVDPPQVLLVLAWNFADAIVAKHRDFLAAGRRFLVPLPELRFVSEIEDIQ